MPYCSNCGKEQNESFKYCPYCGTEYPSTKNIEKAPISHANAPSDVLSYLTSDEKLIRTEKTDEWEIFVTDKRVMFKKGGIFGKELVEASYKHISSIELKKTSPLSLIVTGIALIIIGLIQYTFLNELQFVGTVSFWLLIVFIILGIVSIVASFFLKPQFKIHVVGREPLTVSGKLEEIIKIIRQYREKVQTE